MPIVKKIIVALAVSSLLMTGSGIVRAQTYEETRPFTAKRIVSKVMERLGIGDEVEETDEAGQDMYILTYRRLREKTNAAASRRAADELGLTTAEVEQFASGDIGGIMATAEDACRSKVRNEKSNALAEALAGLERGDPRIREITDEITAKYEGITRGCGMTRDQALAFVDNFQTFLNDARQDEILAEEVGQRVRASEIYADGDTENSGFDLLVDLDIIEKLLFQHETVTYPRAVSPAEKTMSLPELLEEREAEAAPAPPAGGAAPPAPPPAPAPPAPGAAGGLPPVPPEPETGGPETCFADRTLENALDAYDRTAPSGGPRTGTLRNPLTGGAAPGSAGDAELTSQFDRTHLGDDLTPAPPARRITEEFCAGTDPDDKLQAQFCLEWSVKTRLATAFAEEDNCVACHIEHMNDLFKKTLNHNLIPGKITGNPFEPAQCKSGLGLVKFDVNINVLFNPIVTPPNDNLLLQPSAFATWKRVKQLYPYFFADKENVDEPIPTIEDYTAQRLFSFARKETSRTAIIKDMEKIVKIEKAKIEQDLRKLETSMDVEARNSTTQALDYEMRTMLQLFESFKKLFADIATGPCKALLDKPVTQ